MPIAYYNRGVAYGVIEAILTSAIEDYTKAIELKPDFAIAYINRGVAYNDKGDHDFAIADCIKAIHLKPNFAEAYNNRGGCLQASQRRFDRAIEDHSKAIELNPRLCQSL